MTFATTHSSPRTDADDFSITSSLSVPSSPISVMSAHRVHNKFYINDELTVFLVNNEVLFKVHRHALDRESEIFRAFPTGTDESPVPLDDVNENEFVTLLEYFYDRVHGDTPRSHEEWSSLLSISFRFKFEKIRDRAIKELTAMNIDPVDRVVLAVKYDVSDWLCPAYVDLCIRSEPLREDEAHKLELSTTVKLACARERLRANPQSQSGSSQLVTYDNFGFSQAPSAPAYNKDLAKSIIVEIFKIGGAAGAEVVVAWGEKKKGKKGRVAVVPADVEISA